MENELINQEYLQELLLITQDQDESELIDQMFGRLVESRNVFLEQSNEMLSTDHKKLQFELHKLKNQFANLGCVAVSSLLERMYQLAKREEATDIEALLQEFKSLSDRTLRQLKNEIQH